MKKTKNKFQVPNSIRLGGPREQTAKSDGSFLGLGAWGLGLGTFPFLIPLYLYTFMPLSAQQIGMLSNYFYKPMIYNPAFTGSDDGTNILLINHTQWFDFKGAPRFNIFTVDRNFMKKKVGLGLELISDRKGINNRTGGNLFYAHRLNIAAHTHLSLGMSFGMINQTLDYSKALVENTSDPALFPDSQHKTTYDGNAGLAFVWKELEFGAAVPQLFGNKINFIGDGNMRAYYTQERHYLGSLKYKFDLSEYEDISIAPQGLLRFVPNAPFQYDGNINFEWKNKFWVGATYRSDYAVTVNAGFCIHQQFSVGYSYDIITGSIGNYSGLSHEIMVNIQLGKESETGNLWIAANQVRDFKNAKNQPPKKGFYVVVSKFHSIDSAKQEVTRLINEGFAANWLYFEPANFYYVFIAKKSNKEDASKQVKNAFRIARFEDVWIQRVR